MADPVDAGVGPEAITPSLRRRSVPWSGSFAYSGSGPSQGRLVKLGVSQSNVQSDAGQLTYVQGCVWRGVVCCLGRRIIEFLAATSRLPQAEVTFEIDSTGILWTEGEGRWQA